MEVTGGAALSTTGALPTNAIEARESGELRVVGVILLFLVLLQHVTRRSKKPKQHEQDDTSSGSIAVEAYTELNCNEAATKTLTVKNH
ncbi:MAG: hypothetical protein WCN27_03535 [Alphaproteobacteria bacterium]